MAKQYWIRKTDDQTIDPTLVPATNTGTVWQMLSRLANRIKAITGKTSWYDWPTVTLEDAASHHARTDNPHSATAAQTGALVSVDGVSNPGGNVDFVAGTGMTITPDDSGNTVTFASSGGGSSAPFPDNTALVKDDADATKLLRVDAGNIATATTRVLTMPNKNVDLAAIPGTDVTNTPAGNIAATTVQAAINELDTEKAPVEAAGVVKMYAGSSAPTGYLICDGAAVSRTTYAALFTALGGAVSPWGLGDGSTTFNVPDMRGRVPIGVGTGTGLTARALAGQVGVESQALTTANLPSHNHGGASGAMSANSTHSHTSTLNQASNTTVTGASNRYQVGTGSTIATDTADLSHTHSIPSEGSGTTHNNMQPSVALHFIVKT